MATTRVNVDQKILARAKAIYGVRTNREAIDRALRDSVLRHEQLAAINVLSSLPLDADPQPVDLRSARPQSSTNTL